MILNQQEIEYGMKVMTHEQAKAKGYRAITIPYSIETRSGGASIKELEFFHRAIEQLQGTNSVIVTTTQGPELWRHNSEMDIDPDTGLKKY